MTRSRPRSRPGWSTIASEPQHQHAPRDQVVAPRHLGRSRRLDLYCRRPLGARGHRGACCPHANCDAQQRQLRRLLDHHVARVSKRPGPALRRVEQAVERRRERAEPRSATRHRPLTMRAAGVLTPPAAPAPSSKGPCHERRTPCSKPPQAHEITAAAPTPRRPAAGTTQPSQ